MVLVVSNSVALVPPLPCNHLEPTVCHTIVREDYSVDAKERPLIPVYKDIKDCVYIACAITCSAGSRGWPNSCCVNSINTTVPSHEHAARRRPQGDQLVSNTECVNNSRITTKGLFSDVNHTDNERSRDPIATQQYCCGFEEPGCFFCSILPLNLWKKVIFIRLI